MLVMQRFSKETAREYAIRVIRHNIVTLELKPGSTVSENELALELGLSRTPVREAMIELGRTGMIETFPQRGSCISLIDFNLVEEAVFLRRVLETAVVELACDTATDEDFLALEENVRLQDFYLQNPVAERLIELDNAFHHFLFTICKKERIYDLMGGMMMHFDRVRALSMTSVKNGKIVSDHKMILELIRQKDKVAAVEAITKHLLRYKLDQDEIYLGHPEYFKTRA